MNLDNITAENMKKLATKYSENIKYFLTLIKKEAEEGKLKLYFNNFRMEDTTKKELENLGFKVQIGGRYNEKILL